MKIIISHDVDHLFRKDHRKDLFFPKLLMRGLIDCCRKNISAKEFFSRSKLLLRKEIHNLYDVASLDRSYDIDSSFYFGMRKGLSMNYGGNNALKIIKKIKEMGFETGVHGVEFEDFLRMKEEKCLYEQLLKEDAEGIRIHYVRLNESTLQNLDKVGYKYDSSEFDKGKGTCLKQHYKIGNMWEFPLCLMDVYLPKGFRNKQDESIRLIKRAEENGVKYFTILSHDFYYNEMFSEFKNWYEWLLQWLLEQGYQFTSYKDAIRELEQIN